MKTAFRIACRLTSLSIACLLLLTALARSAHADGGAPNLAYVAGGSHGISIIDISQGKVTGSINAPGDPHAVYLSLDGRFLYVTQPALNRMTMFAARTGNAICSANVPGQPSLVAFDPGTNVLYVGGNGANTVSAIDSTNCAIKFTVEAGGPVYGIQVAQVGSSGSFGGTGNQLWVSNGSDIGIFNSQGKLITSVPVPGGPRYLSIPTGLTAYVTTASGTVNAIDLATRKVVGPLVSGGIYGPMDYDAFTYEVYVPDARHNQVIVLNPVASTSEPLPHEPSSVIPLGVAPISVAITSDGQLGFIALQGGNVAMYDVPGKQLVNTIFVGGTPHFIITGLYPPVIGTTPQQANVLGTIINIAAYILIVGLILVPILLIRRQRSKPKAS